MDTYFLLGRTDEVHRANEASKRLESIPGIGIVGATAIAASLTDPKAFRSGRDFAAWIGLVPRQDSTGGKHKLGPISKQGDRYLRRILVVGAHAVLRRAKQSPEKYPWLTQLLARRPFKGRGHCARQQDGPHRLGAAGQGWHLPGTCARGSVRRGLTGGGGCVGAFTICKGDDDAASGPLLKLLRTICPRLQHRCP
jgi:hypothetical protein